MRAPKYRAFGWTATALGVVVVVAMAAFALNSPQRSQPYGPDPYHPDHRIDVQHYAFRLELSDETDEIQGRTVVDFLIREAGVTSLSLNLVGKNGTGSSATGMTVANVRLGPVGGSAVSPVEFEHADDIIRIPLGDGLTADSRLRAEVDYSGIPADGLIISTNKYGARTFFGDNWPNRARHWLPTVDHVSDKATVEFSVVAPDHYRVVANGTLVEEEAVAGGLRLSHYKTDVPMPTKVMVIGVARFAVDNAGEVAGIPISSWVYPEDREAGFADYRRAVNVVEYFTSQIGPFPYSKLANVQSTTRYGGMENAGNIFYSENSITGTGSNEGLIAHEIAHQWFGDSVTEADWYHIWLSEGFATYFTQLYLEHTHGRDRMNTGLVAQRNAVIRYADRNPDSPVIDTTITDLNELLSTNSYQKGGWVLHMLRRQVGDAEFWDGIRRYYASHRDQNALSSDLQHAMEQASGQSLGWFFDQWLRRPGQPILDVQWSPGDGSSASVTVEQTQPGPPFRFPLDLGFQTVDGNSTEVVTVDVSERRQTFQVTLAGAPASAQLDPDIWLLMQGEIRR